MRINSTKLIFICALVLSGCKDIGKTYTVCTIANDPPKDSSNIALQARLVSDRRHATILVDSACPGNNIGLRFSENQKLSEDKHRIQSFRNELRGDPLDLSLRDYDVFLKGEFILDGEAKDERLGTFYVKEVIAYSKVKSGK